MSENKFYMGKVAFVTGAGSGIECYGTGVCTRRRERDGCGRFGKGQQETARLIEEKGARALAVKCDVTRTEDVKAALDKTIEVFGRLDFAFNNAGVEQRNAAIAEFEEDEWHRILDVNLRGVFLCMKYEIPLLLKQGGGAIVNTSSGAGVIGIKGGAAYAASKHGVNRTDQVRQTSRHDAQNIRVTSVLQATSPLDDGRFHRRHC